MVGKYITIAGYLTGALGILIAVLGDDRTIGFAVFLLGFLMVAGGIISRMFVASDRIDSDLSKIGMRVGAVGLVIALVGALLGVLSSSGLEPLLFKVGFGVITLGVLLSVIGLSRRS